MIRKEIKTKKVYKIKKKLNQKLKTISIIKYKKIFIKTKKL